MQELPVSILVLLFATAAAVVCWAGVWLSRATDALDAGFGWGQAMGGVVLLGVVTNLPEIAITISASLSGRPQVAVGNLLGGIAVQTLLLAVFDACSRDRGKSLTAGSGPSTRVEAWLVIALLAIAWAGHALPPGLSLGGVSPDGVLIVLAWMAGLWWLRRIGRRSTRADARTREGVRPATIVLFALAALATLAGGVALEVVGDTLASRWHMDGALFAATVLAAATSLPEIATGLPAVRRGESTLAVSDILGGNAFLPVLLVLAALITGQSVMPHADAATLHLTMAGIAMTLVVVAGASLRTQRRFGPMGWDSWALIAVYVAAIATLPRG